MTFIAVLAATVADYWLGEPRRWHPLVGFGALISAVEARLWSSSASAKGLRVRGLLGWLVLVLPPVALLIWLQGAIGSPLAFAVDVAVLYGCIGHRSLRDHALAVATPLLAGDLSSARHRLAMIVSRDTGELTPRNITCATLESVLENGNDALFAPIFWFAVAGAPGALLHRLANTLDARWGYRNDRYRDFGLTAARLDDVLNWLPARLCALSYGFAGHLRQALFCWRAQAPLAASPNAGPVMAAGAGALGLRLGGPATYHGLSEWRPELGCGRAPEPRDIHCGLDLVFRALLLWLATLAVFSLVAEQLP